MTSNASEQRRLERSRQLSNRSTPIRCAPPPSVTEEKKMTAHLHTKVVNVSDGVIYPATWTFARGIISKATMLDILISSRLLEKAVLDRVLVSWQFVAVRWSVGE